MTDFPPVPAPPAPTVHDGVPITGPAAADYIDPPAPETPLFVLDGRPVHLRYGLGALRLLEAKFGSVPAAFRLIDQAAQAMQSPDAQSRADVFTVVTDAVVCGLWHVKVAARSGVTDAVGKVRLSDAPDVALEHLDEVPLNQLIVDLQRALTAAFGAISASPGNGGAPADAPAVTAPTPSSPGATGTGSPSSSSAAPTPTSGA